MDSLLIKKVDKQKALFYGIGGILSITAYTLNIKLDFNNSIVYLISWTSSITLSILFALEILPRIKIEFNGNTFIIKDGIWFFSQKIELNQSEIKQVGYKPYSSSRSAGQQNAPLSYGGGFNYEGSDSTTYSITITDNKKNQYEFGKYVSIDNVKTIHGFIKKNESTT